ncbi:hypothetical protein D4R42_05620 [bacterium]|nr:MAG: hypothetical protein D4R42_05620 [bacterium]
MEVLVQISGIRSQRRLKAFVVLLRNTTWKCGTVERLVVNYLQRRHQRCGSAQTPVNDMMQHFELSGKQKSEFLEAMKRLERRGIIKIVFNPFSSSDELTVLSRQGGL